MHVALTELWCTANMLLYIQCNTIQLLYALLAQTELFYGCLALVYKGRLVVVLLGRLLMRLVTWLLLAPLLRERVEEVCSAIAIHTPLPAT